MRYQTKIQQKRRIDSFYLKIQPYGCLIQKSALSLQKEMTFDPIIADRLWSVKYDGEDENAFYQVFDQWSDPLWLRNFFFKNGKDLNDYFRITNVDKAIFDTIDDADHLQCLILDLAMTERLDCIFRPLEPSRTGNMLLGKEKAKGNTPWPNCRKWKWFAIISFQPE